MEQDLKNRQVRLGKLWFLIDIPLFIDTVGIGQLFDAMVRPEWQASSRVRTQVEADAASVKGKGEVASKSGIPVFLQGEVKLGLEGELKNERSVSQAMNEENNRSPEMNLEKIVNRYVNDFPDRILFASETLDSATDMNGDPRTWADIDKLLTEPGIRPLIVMDLNEGVHLMPMFAETIDGQDVPMYERLIEALGIKRTIGRYPQRPGDSSDSFEPENIAYWDAIDDAFDSILAVRVVESARARLHWIDYRLRTKNAKGTTPMHLNILARGGYANGTFAYQFIRRADNYGIRMIGTLKRGKDVNVLGIYER